jgi:hypothetical protein
MKTTKIEIKKIIKQLIVEEIGEDLMRDKIMALFKEVKEEGNGQTDKLVKFLYDNRQSLSFEQFDEICGEIYHEAYEMARYG